MNKPLLKSTLAFAVLSAMAANSQAEDVIQQQEKVKLETIIVTTAGGFEQNIADAPASISVITAEELQKKSYTDVIDAVKNMPGVSVQGGGNNKEITIRGMGASYTSWHGRKLYQVSCRWQTSQCRSSSQWQWNRRWQNWSIFAAH